MKISNPLHLALLALAVFLAGCETTRNTNRSEWWLEADMAGHPAVTLTRGLSRELVLSLMGEPHSIRQKKAAPENETWVYHRPIYNPVEIRTRINSGHTRGMLPDEASGGSNQVSTLVDTVTIRFHNGRLEDVRVNRNQLPGALEQRPTYTPVIP